MDTCKLDELARDVAKSLVETETLKSMVQQNMLILSDHKNRFTEVANEHVVKKLTSELPADECKCVKSIARVIGGIDEHLLKKISGPAKAAKVVYSQWLKFNAKLCKQLVLKSLRLNRRRKTWGAGEKKKKVVLQKPPRKRQADKAEVSDASGASAEGAASSAARPPRRISGKTSEVSLASSQASGVKEEPTLVSSKGSSKDPEASLASSPASGPSPEVAESSLASSMGSSVFLTSDADSDEAVVSSVEITCTGEEVLNLESDIGKISCMVCRRDITASDTVRVSHHGIRHADCLGTVAAFAAAAQAEPLPPTGPSSAKKEAKATKAASKKKAKKLRFGGDEALATARHDQLMLIAKPMTTNGEHDDWTFKVRYEPIKPGKAKSWAACKHQVILRWSSGESKSWPFAYDEETSDDDAFRSSLEKAIAELIENQTKP